MSVLPTKIPLLTISKNRPETPIAPTATQYGMKAPFEQSERFLGIVINTTDLFGGASGIRLRSRHQRRQQ